MYFSYSIDCSIPTQPLSLLNIMQDLKAFKLIGYIRDTGIRMCPFSKTAYLRKRMLRCLIPDNYVVYYEILIVEQE